MTTLTVTEPAAALTRPAARPAAPSQPQAADARSAARPRGVDWPATRHGRQETWERLTRSPLVLANPDSQRSRKLGLALLLGTSLRELRSTGQRTPEELIDRYHLSCRPIRNLLVAYLRERQPALDYTSLNALAIMLGKLFGPILNGTTRASTASTCRPRSPRGGSSGCAP
jgi:hypothetical protein